MPAPIPHTYRTAAGIYHLRYLFPQALRAEFPGLGRELRFSLRTREHRDAKRKTYEHLHVINETVAILKHVGYIDGPKIGFALSGSKERSAQPERSFTKEGDQACVRQALGKQEFYMIMDQIKHTHADGSVTAFNYPQLEDNIAALALYRAAEQRSSELANNLFERMSLARPSLPNRLPPGRRLPPSVDTRKAPPFIDDAAGNYSPLLWDARRKRLVPTLFKGTPIEITVSRTSGRSVGANEVVSIGIVHPRTHKADKSDSLDEVETAPPNVPKELQSAPEHAVPVEPLVESNASALSADINDSVALTAVDQQPDTRSSDQELPSG